MGGAGQYFERGQQVEEGQSLLLRRVNSARWAQLSWAFSKNHNVWLNFLDQSAKRNQSSPHHQAASPAGTSQLTGPLKRTIGGEDYYKTHRSEEKKIQNEKSYQTIRDSWKSLPVFKGRANVSNLILSDITFLTCISSIFISWTKWWKAWWSNSRAIVAECDAVGHTMEKESRVGRIVRY